MRLKTLSIQILLILTLSACMVSTGFLLYFVVFQNETTSNSVPIASNIASLLKQEKTNLPASPENFSLPARLLIPKIKVDAAMENVGLTSKGAMGAPKGPNNVAWFKLSPRPGEIGSSVLDGHSGWRGGRTAVFDNLHKLKRGDKIYVEDKNGKKVSFVVQGLKSYDPKADATAVFTSLDGLSHLNLITCEGIWNEVTRSRSKRLVVFSEKE